MAVIVTSFPIIAIVRIHDACRVNRRQVLDLGYRPANDCDVRTVRLGTFSPSVLVEVAAATGALAAAGLTVTEIPATSSPAQFSDLLDGELDAVLTNPDNVVAYRCLPDNPLNRTADVRILAAVDGGLGLALFSRYEAVDELHGGLLGVDVPASGFAFVAYALLEQLGITDFAVEAMGSTPRRTEALLSGQCAVTVLNAGNDLRAEAAGAHRLASVTSLGPYVATVLAARGDTVLNDGDMLKRLVGTLLTTASALLRGMHADLALEAAQRRLNLDENAGARYLRTLADPTEGLIPSGVMSTEALGTAIDLRNRRAVDKTSLSTVLSSGILDDSVIRSFRRSAADAR
jgi:ABC-type nitrate/sulfonate/bicarbonate transport system substrate-binding protein